MTLSTRISLLAVALAVVTAAMVGVVTGDDQADAATQHTLRIPPAAFTPTNATIDFWNSGNRLRNESASYEHFVAPVLLEGNSQTIHSITLHYFDNGPDTVCANLYRPRMKNGTEAKMATNCTKNASSSIRNRIVTNISPSTVNTDEGVYIYLRLPAGSSYSLYGVTIVYTSNI